jgi:hypothetical protein
MPTPIHDWKKFFDDKIYPQISHELTISTFSRSAVHGNHLEGLTQTGRPSFNPFDIDGSSQKYQGRPFFILHGFFLTGAKRREFSGMIHFITSFIIIPATPSNPSIPYVKRTSPADGHAVSSDSRWQRLGTWGLLRSMIFKGQSLS